MPAQVQNARLNTPMTTFRVRTGSTKYTASARGRNTNKN